MPSYPETKRCATCRRVKGRLEFWKNVNSTGPILRGSCIKCERKRIQERREKATLSLDGFARAAIRTKLIRARHLSKKTTTKVEKRLTQFDIDPEWFVAQWARQRGKCFYTKVPLSRKSGPYKVSIERIDSSLGYLQENCVLACLAINVMKNKAELSEFVWWCRKVSRNCRVSPTPPSGHTTKFFH